RELRTASGESGPSTRDENRWSQTQYPHSSDAEEDRTRRTATPGELREFLYRKHVRADAHIWRSERQSCIIRPARMFPRSARDRDRLSRTDLGPRHVPLPDAAATSCVVNVGGT